MSRNIGILTFHYADNYGAVLQAYALRKVINSFPNCHAEIINYVPKGYVYSASPDDVVKKRIKREKFNTFLSKHCGISTPMLHSVTGKSKDLYVVGSDQIWNMDLPEAATDYEYLLPNLDDSAKRIAYSASIGMNIEKIDKVLFGKYLPKFDHISLREKNYVEIISELSGKKCEYTLDPTLLLKKEDYESLIEKPDTADEPYVLYFWYDMGDGGLESVELVNTLSRKYNFSIKHSFDSETSLAKKLLINSSGYVMSGGIGEFLWYMKNAEAVVTNSFHGMVFSILFRKPLFIYYPAIRGCRQENLVNLLNLQDRVFRGYTGIDRLGLEMNYEPVFSLLEKERERSISYLRSAIDTV